MKRYFLSCKAALGSKLLLQVSSTHLLAENVGLFAIFDIADEKVGFFMYVYTLCRSLLCYL